MIVLPITSAPKPPVPGGDVTERDFAPRSERAPRTYRDLLELPPELRRKLPRAFDVIGDVVLVRIPPELERQAPRIGAALLAFVPGARRVGWDRGVEGPLRRRTIEPLAGTGTWRTRHRENGVEFVVDPEVAYFSPRLAREHALVADRVRAGDRVLDLCCGVGPFALTIARSGRARSIVAVDANPEAIALLRENAVHLGVVDRVRAVEARIETFLTETETADFLVYNLPHEGIKYLPSVSEAVAPGGSLQYYEVVPRAAVRMRAEELVNGLPRPAEWCLRSWRRVHPYSPLSDLIAFTLERS
jgi:tRNA (guanine37-N1)-methyltransferase